MCDQILYFHNKTTYFVLICKEKMDVDKLICAERIKTK